LPAALRAAGFFASSIVRSNLVPKTIIARFTWVFVFILLFIASFIYGVIVLRGEPKLIEAQTQAAEQSAMAISRKLELKLAEIEGRTASIASFGESLPLNDDQVKGSLSKIIDATGDISVAGGGLWPEPNAFKSGVSLYSFYWARSAQGALTFSDENNSPGIAPYQAADCDAYVDPISKVLMTTCSVAYNRDSRLAGVNRPHVE
jgi:methyl-accepting chemotaxis protein